MAVVNSNNLRTERKSLSKHLDSSFIRVVNEQCSCHAEIACAMDTMKVTFWFSFLALDFLERKVFHFDMISCGPGLICW